MPQGKFKNKSQVSFAKKKNTNQIKVEKVSTQFVFYLLTFFVTAII